MYDSQSQGEGRTKGEGEGEEETEEEARPGDNQLQRSETIRPRVAYTVPEFCAAVRMSLPLYYKIKSEGNGPVEGHIGKRVVISFENAAKWLKEIEDAAKTAPKKVTVAA